MHCQTPKCVKHHKIHPATKFNIRKTEQHNEREAKNICLYMYFSNINLLSKNAQNIIQTCHLTILLKSPLEIYGKTKQIHMR